MMEANIRGSKLRIVLICSRSVNTMARISDVVSQAIHIRVDVHKRTGEGYTREHSIQTSAPDLTCGHW
jgi:hypothetical protein